MRHLLSPALISLIVVVSGILALPTAARAVPSCINAGNVTGIGAGGCDLGPLNFSNFVVSPTGVAANIFLGALSNVDGLNTNLAFQVSHSPSPANLADIMFLYTAKTLSGAATIGGVDLYSAGHNVTIRETACATPFVNGFCATGLLADNVATDNTLVNSVFTPQSAIYLRKDIMLGPDSFISEFTNSHDDAIAPTPEPATLILLGSTIAGLGMAARRRSRTPTATA